MIPNSNPESLPSETAQDAIELCEKEHDNFYLTAFVFEGWVGQLLTQAAAEYAEKKNARDRSLQTGQAWHGFQTYFGHATDQEFPHIISSLFRFVDYADPLPTLLRRALVPLSIEHECTGDYFGPKAPLSAEPTATALALARRSIARWCDWLDALIHFQTHEYWHLAPLCFDPDAEKRELALLGTNQRHFAHLAAPAKARWQWHHGDAADRFKNSPKWPAVGKAMAAEADRPWPYQEVDGIVISLWPLVKLHNWTYRDLLNVVREAVKRPRRYPCEREQDFATYCTNTLGLHKTLPGVTAKNGRPVGHEVARRLCAVPA